ncbi:related to Extracellular guanyl-specific ribonuclease Fl2 [Cephalotrichum gorgonifer]|uniref:ribonuclease T1 n=1 Tax=Cephalotrichum gorgonifer TaxID=2041049 RepID=A0AAE8SS96_9PEZI|nr:related to Extracellular guanyl-specific ribonuclease Fl2 [Cephalotrichum gorgonifer]
MQLQSLLIASLAALTAAQGTANVSSITCGSAKYSQQQIDDAVGEGCRLYDERRTLGNNKYPHRFNNREGLVFATSGPYQEFPIIASGNYSGGSPGADRVVIDPAFQGSCVFVGGMTHTGASTRNGFVECSEEAANQTVPGSTGGSGNDDDGLGVMVAPTFYLAASGIVASLLMAL